MVNFNMLNQSLKNNFNDYGFEADFEGEILTELDCFYIGWIKTRDIRDNDIFKIGKFLKSNGHFCTSTENGELNIAKFNLKKINLSSTALQRMVDFNIHRKY